MDLKKYLALSCLLLVIAAPASAVSPLPTNLIKFTSPLGLAFNKHLTANAFKLLAQFTTQETPTYCGVASLVMILNATNTAPPLDAQHPPYRYFTQDNFFNAAVSKIIPQTKVLHQGMHLYELSEVANAFRLDAKPIYADQLNEDAFRKTLVFALTKREFIIVNFLRTALHQQGGGHHSPIAGYDKTSDRFLLLDVARYKYPAYWVTTHDLWQAVDTKDQGIYRGVVIIAPH